MDTTGILFFSCKKLPHKNLIFFSGDLVDGPDVNGVSANVVCSPRSRSARSATEHNQIYGTDIKAATYYYNCWVNEFPQDLSKSIFKCR